MPADVVSPLSRGPDPVSGWGTGSRTVASGPPVERMCDKIDVCNGGRFASHRPSRRSTRDLTLIENGDVRPPSAGFDSRQGLWHRYITIGHVASGVDVPTVLYQVQQSCQSMTVIRSRRARCLKALSPPSRISQTSERIAGFSSPPLKYWNFGGTSLPGFVQEATITWSTSVLTTRLAL